MLATLAAITGFALTGAITPGPVNALALRHGCSRSGPAFCYVLGASLSYAGIVWLMGKSGPWLLLQPQVQLWAPRICAAYLLWLAWQLIKAPTPSPHAKVEQHINTHTDTTLPPGLSKAFVQGITIQSLNPKAWLVALSGIGIFIPALTAQQLPPGLALWIFCGISLLACLTGVGCWAVLGRGLAQWINTPRRQRQLNGILSMLLMLSVASMLA